jgi:hypothetical protein
MLDKLKGSAKNNKDTPPDLRKNDDKESSDVGGKIKDLVGKMSGNKGEKKGASSDKLDKKLNNNKMPRPMPKPRIKPKPKPVDSKSKPAEIKPRLRAGVPPKKPRGGGSSGFGRKIPEDDKKTIIGAAVIGIVLIVVAALIYYFTFYAPYQETLNGAKTTKITEVNAYFKGPLAVDPQKQSILAQIDSGVTPEEVLAVDVIGPATQSWRTYQLNQIKIKKDQFNRIMVVYSADTQNTTNTSPTANQKNVIMKVGDAEKFVAQNDATVLANMEIRTPDTVAVPIIITRLQAAGGLITVGNMVDVYLNTASTPATNQTNGTNVTPAAEPSNTPKISGATVLAILRAKDSGTITADFTNTQSMTINSLTSSSEASRTTTADVEQLLRAAAAGGFDAAETQALLQNYGIKLSDYERASNLGELDVQYLVLLEVPREDVVFLIQNMNSIVLTVPTQQAPDWMVTELQRIYG